MDDVISVNEVDISKTVLLLILTGSQGVATDHQLLGDFFVTDASSNQA